MSLRVSFVQKYSVGDPVEVRAQLLCPNREKRVINGPMVLKSSPQTHVVSITQDSVTNAHSQALPQTTKSETLGMRLKALWFNKLSRGFF